MFNVTGTREEITLVFGESRSSREAEREVRLTHRILLNPFAAKRLLSLLNATVEQYEAEHGPHEHHEAVRGSPVPLVAVGSDEESGQNSVMTTAERLADCLIRPIRDLGIPYDFERSFKMFTGRVLESPGTYR